LDRPTALEQKRQNTGQARLQAEWLRGGKQEFVVARSSPYQSFRFVARSRRGEAPKSTLVVRRLESHIRAGRSAFAWELRLTKPTSLTPAHATRLAQCSRSPPIFFKALENANGDCQFPFARRQARQSSLRSSYAMVFRYRLGSKYLPAGVKSLMPAFAMKKSVDWSSHFVTVPSE
jgi:hypothetical protein